MVDYVELKYAMMLSGRLEHFKVTSHKPYKMTFRCPYCGDSKKSTTKTRGWLREDSKTTKLRFKCFNCGYPASFYEFLRDQDQLLFKDFLTERYVSEVRASNNELVLPEHFGNAPVFGVDPLRRISKLLSLPEDHPARVYVTARQIPLARQKVLYVAEKFAEWVNSIIPEKLKKPKRDEIRLILPFLDETKKLFGFSARSLDPKSQLRYITIMIDENMPKVFGLDRIDWDEKYYITEGAIDSLFLDNALAMAGADLNFSSLKHPENAVVVYDAEPRNREIHKAMEKAIAQGFRVCVWPSWVPDKDINSMILAGVEDVETVIADHTYRGLMARAELSRWRKV